MESEDSSGVVGLLIVAVIYVGVTIVAIGFVYIYLKHVHMNGRMPDIYRRVNSSVDDLFIPHDYEISERELRAICAYAKRWRGVGGEHRIVSHCDYEFVDPVMLSTSEKRYTWRFTRANCRRLSFLWRQFIRSPDGAVLEVVSNTSAALSSEVRPQCYLRVETAGLALGKLWQRVLQAPFRCLCCFYETFSSAASKATVGYVPYMPLATLLRTQGLGLAFTSTQAPSGAEPASACP